MARNLLVEKKIPIKREVEMMTNWPPPDDIDLPKDGWAWSDFTRPVFDFACVLRDADLMPDDEDEYWEKPRK